MAETEGGAPLLMLPEGLPFISMDPSHNQLLDSDDQVRSEASARPCSPLLARPLSFFGLHLPVSSAGHGAHRGFSVHLGIAVCACGR